MVRGEDHAAVAGRARGRCRREPEVEQDRRLANDADRPVDGRVHAAPAGARVVELERARSAQSTHPGHRLSYPPGLLALRCRCERASAHHERCSRGSCRRGDLGGPAAARQAGLRLALRRRGAARQARHARRRMARRGHRHSRGQRGGVRRRLLARAPVRTGAADRHAGAGAALAEHLAHLAARDLRGPLPPRAQGARAAARATRARSRRPPGGTCCSALVLGELERRLNAQGEFEPLEDVPVASNGHGNIEHAAAGAASAEAH